MIRWIAPVAAAVLIVASMVRTGVDLVDVVRFASYWVLAVLCPGLVVARALLGCRRTLIEDVAVAGATGISLEIVVSYGGVVLGFEAVRFWWLPVLVAAGAIPTWRRRVFRRVDERVPLLHSTALSATIALIVMGLDVRSFRATPLPPRAGEIYFDNWWQLSIVQELMKYEPPQVPQVVGEPLNYHFFANLHVASASRLSGVLPEVVLFRLWLVPVVFVSVGLAVVLGRTLTSSLTAGVATAGLTYAIAVGSYIWPTLARNVPATSIPILFHSPSQVLANVGIMAAAIGVVLLLRLGPSPGLTAWLVIVLVAGSGMKSTVVPILVGGGIVALVRAVWTRSPRVRPLAALVAGLVVLQIAILTIASGTSGGAIVPLGTLRMLRMYRRAVGDWTLHGTNSGLVLDSIDSWRAAAFAAIGLVVIVGVQTVRVAGVFTLFQRRARGDLVTWWLAGAVVAGYIVLLTIDHIGTGQVWFAYGSGQLGVALTVSALWSATAGPHVERRAIILKGLAVGAALTLIVSCVAQARRRVGGYGMVDEVVVPLMTLLLLVIPVAWWWTRRTPANRRNLWPVALASVIGVLIPPAAVDAGRTVYRWVQPVEYSSGVLPDDAVSERELSAMTWLRDNSAPADVIATNLHCRPAPNEPYCDARGFWVVGLSGRRAVLEGWAYTDEAQALQGVEGRSYSHQPAPFVERARLNDAVFDDGDLDALRELELAHDVRWLVAVHRAGPVPSFPADLAAVRFDNGEVTIFEVP